MDPNNSAVQKSVEIKDGKFKTASLNWDLRDPRTKVVIPSRKYQERYNRFIEHNKLDLEKKKQATFESKPYKAMQQLQNIRKKRKELNKQLLNNRPAA